MDDAAQGPPMPASRGLAFGAFLLAVTSLLLPWWRITWTSAGVVAEQVRAFRPEPPLTTSWGPWVTGALAAAAVALLFVRLAARSERYEPAVWRRDLAVTAGLLAAALLSCLLWPADVPAFWGGRTYAVENVSTEVHERAAPALGWWTAAAALALAALARWRARSRDAPAP